MTPLTLVLAVADNGVIGAAGGIPWNEPEDRAHFFDVTRGHAVIMGRRTFEETGVALPERHNLVVSHALHAPNVEVFPSLTAAIDRARQLDPDPRVIGGEHLFAEAMPLATRILMTRIPGSPDGDTFFRFSLADFVIAEEHGERLRFVDYRRRT